MPIRSRRGGADLRRRRNGGPSRHRLGTPSIKSAHVGVPMSPLKLLLMFLILFVVVTVGWVLFFSSVEITM